ncbi:hypothetical protein HRbin09_01751 [bacterium HR09]|nr:hypothetical protein HRbin09_01751 [bacterium HR09]
MHITSLGVQLQLFLLGDAGELAVFLGGGGNSRVSHQLGFLKGLLRPGTGDDVIRGDSRA